MCDHLAPTEPALIVTVDVEDWPQSTFDTSLEVSDRVVTNTHRLLDLLGDHRQKTTMFVLGKVAERFPRLVERIASEGHEVASHGYGHHNIRTQSREQFRDDVERSRKLLEDITGQLVLGYRAPDFSVTSETFWALDALAEAGFAYDSSVFPIGGNRYGIPWWPRQPVMAQLKSGRSIAEIPLATLDFLGRRWPVAGGGYHRLLPDPFITWCIARHLQRNEVFTAYYHPYELAPEEFSLLPFAVPLRLRIHQGLGRRSLQRKLSAVLQRFRSVPCYELLLSHDLPPYVVTHG